MPPTPGSYAYPTAQPVAVGGAKASKEESEDVAPIAVADIELANVVYSASQDERLPQQSVLPDLDLYSIMEEDPAVEASDR